MSTESMARKRPPDILDPFEGDQNVLKESAKSYASLSGNIKRKRLECPSSSTSCTPPVSSITPLPAIPLLYQLALSAHHSSQRHLQQAFIPSSVLCEADAGYPPIASTGQIPLFIHDARAHDKALGLLLLALDLLRIALASNELSDKERVAFTLEFGVVGVKLLAVFRPTAPLKGNETQVEDKVDVERLMGDVQYAVASGVCRETWKEIIADS